MVLWVDETSVAKHRNMVRRDLLTIARQLNGVDVNLGMFPCGEHLCSGRVLVVVTVVMLVDRVDVGVAQRGVRGVLFVLCCVRSIDTKSCLCCRVVLA